MPPESNRFELPPCSRKRPRMPEKEIVVTVFGCPSNLLNEDQTTPTNCHRQTLPNSGQGGVGKTLLCTRFLRQHHDDFVKAITAQRIQEDDYVDLTGTSRYFGSVRGLTACKSRLRYHVLERASSFCSDTAQAFSQEKPDRHQKSVTPDRETAMQAMASVVMNRNVGIVGEASFLPVSSNDQPKCAEHGSTVTRERMPDGLTVRGFIGVIDPTKGKSDISTQIAFLRQCHSALQALGSGVAMSVAVTKCDLLTDDALTNIEQKLACGLAIGENVPCYYMSSLKGLGVGAAFEDVARRALSLPGRSPPTWAYDLLSKARQQTLQTCSKRFAQSVVKQVCQSAVVSWWEKFQESLLQDNGHSDKEDSRSLSAGRALKTLVDFQGESVCRDAFLEQLSDVVGHMLEEGRDREAEREVILPSYDINDQDQKRYERLVGGNGDALLEIPHRVVPFSRTAEDKAKRSSPPRSRGTSPNRGSLFPVTPTNSATGPPNTSAPNSMSAPRSPNKEFSPVQQRHVNGLRRDPTSSLPRPPRPSNPSEYLFLVSESGPLNGRIPPNMTAEVIHAFSERQVMEHKQLPAATQRSNTESDTYARLSSLTRSSSPEPYMLLLNKQRE